MRKLVTACMVGSILVSMSPWSAWASQPPAGFVDLKDFQTAESDYVEVQLGSHLLELAARLVDPSEPDIAAIIRGLRRVHVHVIGLTEANRSQVTDRINTTRRELDDAGWERVVTVHQEGDDVSVQLKAGDADSVEGVMVSVLTEDRQAVLVNIVGQIRPDQIGEVIERLNIPPLREFHRKLHQATEGEHH